GELPGEDHDVAGLDALAPAEADGLRRLPHAHQHHAVLPQMRVHLVGALRLELALLDLARGIARRVLVHRHSDRSPCWSRMRGPAARAVCPAAGSRSPDLNRCSTREVASPVAGPGPPRPRLPSPTACPRPATAVP